ncbi:MAG: hypothetical protein ABFS34_04175 [Gemmatimonadota bacterium]
MLHHTGRDGRTAFGAVGPTAILLAALLAAGCGETATSPLSSEVTGATFAASPNSGAVVSSDVITIAGPQPNIQGTTVAKCVNGGTQINVHMTGLQPKALYTIWIVELESPGFAVAGFDAIIGLGALGNQTPAGPNDGYKNVFRASTSGVGQITKYHPAGPESVFGEAPSCLTDPALLFEFHVVGNIHADGLAWGPVPWPGFPAPEPPEFGFDEFAFIITN